MILFQIYCFGFTLIIAGLHAELIDAGKKILHGLWAGIYVVLILVLIYLLGLPLFLAFSLGVLIRALFFDIWLNVFRGLRMDYRSLTTTSIYDKLTRKWDFWTMHIVFGVLIAILNFIYAMA